MDATTLATRLHQINLLDMPEQFRQCVEQVRLLNLELAGTGLRCAWAVEEEVWVLREGRANER